MNKAKHRSLLLDSWVLGGRSEHCIPSPTSPCRTSEMVSEGGTLFATPACSHESKNGLLRAEWSIWSMNLNRQYTLTR